MKWKVAKEFLASNKSAEHVWVRREIVRYKLMQGNDLDLAMGKKKRAEKD